MSTLLTLNSGLVPNQNSDDFTIDYGSGLDVSGDWSVGLLNAYLWYSYYNVSAEAGNNILKYYNGVSTKTITIPDGQYSVTDLNNFMHVYMEAQGDWDAVAETYYVTLSPNFNTIKVDVVISGGYQLDLTGSTIHDLLGFDSVILTVTTSSTKLVDITNNLNSLNINCSLTDSGFSNQFPGSTIQTTIPNVSPGSSIIVAPNPVVYLPVNTQVIRKIRMWITDQAGVRVNFNGETLVYTLHLKKIH